MSPVVDAPWDIHHKMASDSVDIEHSGTSKEELRSSLRWKRGTEMLTLLEGGLLRILKTRTTTSVRLWLIHRCHGERLLVTTIQLLFQGDSETDLEIHQPCASKYCPSRHY